jgi:hypothetical protein
MADLLRVSLQGTLPGGEEWSVNPCFTLDDTGTTVTYDQLNTVVSAINSISIPTSVRLMQSTSTNNTGCRVEARKLTGELEALAEGVRGTAIPGTGTSAHSYQTALVTSLRTAQAGATGRGRVYWPATGMIVSASSLRPSAADVTSALAGVKTYLAAITTAIAPTLGSAPLIVWSRSSGGRYLVNRLLMGDVLDVQRRRRDAAVESYQQLVYP